MDLSLNEVEAQSRKAAKGAGYTWGEAEDTGKAVRWLCMQGIDGCHHLAVVLQRQPTSASCPIRQGIHLSDNAQTLKLQSLTFSKIEAPTLFLPFAASAAIQLECPIQVMADDWSMVVFEDRCEVLGTVPDSAGTMTVATTKAKPAATQRMSRAKPRQESWDVLCSFAHRTYAPATEESRMLGAGAGLSDND